MRMIQNNKKGLSSIVITLLIVTLGLVAIGGVWMVVRNLLQSNSKQVQTNSLTIDLDAINAYEEAGVVNVRVTRLVGEGQLIKIKFILDDGGNKEAITKDVTDFEEYDTSDFVLTPTKLIPGTIKTVSIAPVFMSGTEEMVGSITDIQTLRNLFAQETGEEETGEEEEEECTPICGTKICGAASNVPACGGADACGTCTTGTCSEDQLTCVGCTAITECTGGKICGTESNGCGGTITCGTCDAGSLCSTDQLICNEVILLDEGTVSESWPGSSGLYVGSPDLPTDQATNYFGKSIKFFDGETAFSGCLSIANFIHPIDGYAKSHIAFSFETMVEVGFTYKIYSTPLECNAAA